MRQIATLLLLAVAAVSADKPNFAKTNILSRHSFLDLENKVETKTKSDWEQCSFPQENEKSGEYFMQIESEGKWKEEVSYLIKCKQDINPLYMRWKDKEVKLRWPTFSDANSLFKMQHKKTHFYGVRLEVSDIERQNWHFMYMRFPNLESLNKFVLGGQTHLNLRQNNVDAHWTHFTNQDFIRAPEI